MPGLGILDRIGSKFSNPKIQKVVKTAKEAKKSNNQKKSSSSSKKSSSGGGGGGGRTYSPPTETQKEEIAKSFQKEPTVKGLKNLGVIKEPEPEPEPVPEPVKTKKTTGPTVITDTQKDKVVETFKEEPQVKQLTNIGLIPKEDQKQKEAWDKFLNESEGKEFRVKWRGPGGDVKTVVTYDLKNIITNIPEEHGGQVIQIYPQTKRNVVNRNQGVLTNEYEENVLSSPTTNELIEQYKEEQRIKYKDTGNIPGDIKKSLIGQVPPEISGTIGTDEYIRYSYEVMIGVRSEEEASQALQTDLKKSYDFMRLYGYDKSFADIQKEEPAARLKQKASGEYEIVLDYEAWNRAQMEYAGRGETVASTKIPFVGAGQTPLFNVSLAQIAKGFGEITLKGFASPGAWYKQLTKGEGFKEISKQSYYTQKKIQSGNIKSYVIEDAILADPMKYIVYPFAAGAGFTAGFGAVGAAGSAAGGTTGAVLSTYASTAPWVAGGIMSGVIGADLGYSKALEDAGKLPEGTTGTKALAISMAIGSAAAGSSWASNPATQAAFKQFGRNTTNRFNRSIEKFPGLNRQIQNVKSFRQVGYEQKLMAQSVKDYPFHSLEGTKAPLGYKVRSYFKNINYKEPGPSYYIQKYGTGKGVTRSDALYNRPPYGKLDLFAQRAPAKWGGYETSWNYYRGSMVMEGYRDTGFIREFQKTRVSSVVRNNKYLFEPKTKQVIKLETDYKTPIAYKGKVIELSNRPGFEFRTPEYTDPTKIYRGQVTNIELKYTKPYPDLAKGGLPKARDVGEVMGYQAVRQTSYTPWKFKPVVKGGGYSSKGGQVLNLNTVNRGVSTGNSVLNDISKYEWYAKPWKPYTKNIDIVKTKAGPIVVFAREGNMVFGPTFLNFLEEGTGTASGYWDKTIKDIRSQSKTGTGFINISKTDIGTVNLNKMGMGILTGSALKISSLNRMGQSTINASIQNQLSLQSSMLKQDQLLKQKLDYKLLTSTVTIPKTVYNYDYTFENTFDKYFGRSYKKTPGNPLLPEDNLAGFMKRYKTPLPNIFGRGYRYRRIKVPKLENLFRGVF